MTKNNDKRVVDGNMVYVNERLFCVKLKTETEKIEYFKTSYIFFCGAAMIHAAPSYTKFNKIGFGFHSTGYLREEYSQLIKDEIYKDSSLCTKRVFLFNLKTVLIFDTFKNAKGIYKCIVCEKKVFNRKVCIFCRRKTNLTILLNNKYNKSSILSQLPVELARGILGFI